MFKNIVDTVVGLAQIVCIAMVLLILAGCRQAETHRVPAAYLPETHIPVKVTTTVAAKIDEKNTKCLEVSFNLTR